MSHRKDGGVDKQCVISMNGVSERVWKVYVSDKLRFLSYNSPTETMENRENV